MTKYLVRVSRHYFQGTIHYGRVSYYGVNGMDISSPLVAFDTHADARQTIEAFNSATCLLGHGECARPTLTAVPTTMAPAWVQERLTW